MKIKEVIDYLETLYPLQRQEQWDHSGLQIGNFQDELKGVMVCLNADESTIAQAIENNCNLLISHHPFLFHPLQTIDFTSVKGQLVYQCCKHQLTIYSMHTNYDALRMNEHLLEILNCHSIHSFEPSGICKAGYLQDDLSLEDFICYVKNKFSIDLVRLSGRRVEKIHSVAICGGSGASFFEQATKDYDIYMTGDFNYNHATELLCLDKGLVLGVPHFIEQVFKKQISEDLQHLAISTFLAREKDYFTYY